ncbi:hypothetical protein SMC26_33075 [Actinomadura fulvescens]|uniref:Chromosome partition protein Smc n=1 Tax=Actinomadura fulvescens TaxID=46160 RepID=A0ABP6CJA6_9ACTN
MAAVQHPEDANGTGDEPQTEPTTEPRPRMTARSGRADTADLVLPSASPDETKPLPTVDEPEPESPSAQTMALPVLDEAPVVPDTNEPSTTVPESEATPSTDETAVDPPTADAPGTAETDADEHHLGASQAGIEQPGTGAEPFSPDKSHAALPSTEVADTDESDAGELDTDPLVTQQVSAEPSSPSISRRADVAGSDEAGTNQLGADQAGAEQPDADAELFVPDEPQPDAELFGSDEPQLGEAGAALPGANATDAEQVSADGTLALPVVEGPERLGELVDEVYVPLIGVYEELESRLRERSTSGGRPVGWAAHLEAMRSFREGRVTGDWDELAEFLVEGRVGARTRVVEVDDDEAEVATARAAVLEGGERVLLLAPTVELAERVVEAVGDEVFALKVEATAPDQADVGTIMDIEPPPNPEVEPAPAGIVRGATVSLGGDAWRKAWRAEAKQLQRELLWLEQWPRDTEVLDKVKAKHERFGERMAAEIERLEQELSTLRTEAAQAEQAITESHEERDRLAEEAERLAGETAEPRAEAERLQALADTAAAEAGEHTRTADEAYARCVALDQEAARCQAELEEARRAEASLVQELARAQEDLPRATEEAERLNSAATDAEAEWHTRYYRLKSAESTLAAQRRKLTFGQRLHVSAPPPRLEELRIDVKTQAREAEEAATRARQATEVAERAAAHHAGLARFISEGGAGLAAAQAAQERLTAHLSRLAADRESATTAHREQARQAAEAVDVATQASMAARQAQQVARQAEEQLAVAYRAHRDAVAAAEHAGARAETAAQQAAAAANGLAQRRAESERELVALRTEIDTAAEAEARSREKVQEICGTQSITEHQSRAMARIEELSGHLEGTELPVQLLLDKAGLVGGTPETVGASPVITMDYDTLVVVGAARLNDADLLVGAVHARNQVLIGAPGQTPPEYAEYVEIADADRLTQSPFTRAIA